jgi:multiple sugar transport system ATP-binding protein
MRTSLQELHRRLGTTTVYVTHDQVEAMTLGQRVAVMHDGRIQQVDPPQRLYDRPANLFVAAFIGSPAMNLVHGRVSGSSVHIGQFEIPLGPELVAAGVDGEVIVGIRPEAFEDDEFAPAGLPRIGVGVRVLEELGSDAHVFFAVEAESVVVEDAQSSQEDEGSILLTARDEVLFGARVDPRTQARVGDNVRLAVDPTRLYFFSAQTGESLLGRVAATAAP